MKYKSLFLHLRRFGWGLSRTGADEGNLMTFQDHRKKETTKANGAEKKGRVLKECA